MYDNILIGCPMIKQQLQEEIGSQKVPQYSFLTLTIEE